MKFGFRQGALYGGGLPPFEQYIKYIGKPLYKLSRKMHVPYIGALAIANIPGSLSHVSGTLSRGDWDNAAIGFAISEVLCFGFFYGVHKFYSAGRKKNNKNVISSLVASENLESMVE